MTMVGLRSVLGFCVCVFVRLDGKGRLESCHSGELVTKKRAKTEEKGQQHQGLLPLTCLLTLSACMVLAGGQGVII